MIGLYDEHVLNINTDDRNDKMSYELCDKVSNLEPYEPITGSYRIRLDANESFFPMPEEIRSEIKDIIDHIAFNRYPDPMAKKLIDAFAEYYGIDADNVTATNGSDEMLYLLSSAMLKRNSTVIVAEPDFSMYRFYSFLSENTVFALKKDEGLKIDVDELIRLANEKNADMIIFSNPCNPTGQGISAEEARRLVRSVSALVVLDEAYMDFWDQPLLKEAAGYDNLIVLKTASKAVGSAAIRLGFAVANKTLTKALRSVKSPYNVNTLSQEIGACIFSKKELLRQRRDQIIESTRSLYEELLKLKQNYKLPFDIPEPCANFVFVRCEMAEDIFNYLLENGIAVRFFGNASALRITSGSKEENDGLLVALEKYIMEKYLSSNR